MVNFGPPAAEIFSLVWGTPGNFNGFRVFAALLHGTLVVGVSQTAALNRGRHLYSAGRPSRWALAHISSSFYSSAECEVVIVCDTRAVRLDKTLHIVGISRALRVATAQMTFSHSRSPETAPFNDYTSLD